MNYIVYSDVNSNIIKVFIDMAKTITVEIQSTTELPDVPEGKRLVFKDGKFFIKDIIPVLPETWEEFCKLRPIQKGECVIDEYSVIREMQNSLSTRHNKADRNVLPSREAAEAHIAYMQLHQLRDFYRQGWKPDWSDRDSVKYSITFCGNNNDYIISPCWHSRHFLSFQSYELAEKFLNCFKSFIVQASDLI